MKTPKIHFVYSTQYNNLWTDWFKAYMSDIYNKRMKEMKKNGKKQLSEQQRIKKTSGYIRKLEKIWRKDEEKILEELSRITGLKWREESLDCYIILAGKGGIFPPLTVRIKKKLNDFVDGLIHELIHCLFRDEVRDSEYSREAWKYINKRYESENQSVIRHILLFAIMQDAYSKFFNLKRLESYVNTCQPHQIYARAWQIVQQEGYQNIIREFRKRIA